MQFLPLDAMLHRVIRVTIHPSQVNVLQRWLNLAQELYSFLVPIISAKFQQGWPVDNRGAEVE